MPPTNNAPNSAHKLNADRVSVVGDVHMETRTVHLRVPRFGAYKPPRSEGPVPADKPGFFLFSLPVKSSPEISELQHYNLWSERR